MHKLTHIVAIAGILGSTVIAATLTAAGPGWIGKQAVQWSAEDAGQILTNSPWARVIMGGIAGRKSEDQLREGGAMGQPHGAGYDGVDPKGSGPKVDLNIFTGRGGDDRSQRSRPGTVVLKVVWESALPVRLAELKTNTVEPPTLEGDGYQIAVYGIPGASFREDPKRLGDPLKERAALKRAGKKDVKPIRVEVFQRQDGLAAVFLFPLSAELSRKDLQVQFEAHIGRVTVAHTFNLQLMEYLGKLEL